jgi:hypothetical protein
VRSRLLAHTLQAASEEEVLGELLRLRVIPFDRPGSGCDVLPRRDRTRAREQLRALVTFRPLTIQLIETEQEHAIVDDVFVDPARRQEKREEGSKVHLLFLQASMVTGRTYRGCRALMMNSRISETRRRCFTSTACSPRMRRNYGRRDRTALRTRHRPWQAAPMLRCPLWCDVDRLATGRRLVPRYESTTPVMTKPPSTQNRASRSCVRA